MKAGRRVDASRQDDGDSYLRENAERLQRFAKDGDLSI
jgi:hypothetical protein